MIEKPKIKSKWKSKKHGTRHVVDYTLGGHIVYIQGRMPINPWLSYYHKKCTLEEWEEYQKTAEEI